MAEWETVQTQPCLDPSAQGLTVHPTKAFPPPVLDPSALPEMPTGPIYSLQVHSPAPTH